MCCCFLLNFMIYSGYAAPGNTPAANSGVPGLSGNTVPGEDSRQQNMPDQTGKAQNLARPEFYRGIYLHNYSARTPSILSNYVTLAKQHGVNAFVMDMQDAVYFQPGAIPASNIELCISNKIWPIARIVVFPYGLKEYPAPPALISDRLELARKAYALGFREIQFDYIRFEDSGRFGHISYDARYQLVEGFLGQARNEFGSKGTYISADVFGRVALNLQDPIGQRLEGLDKVVNVICPMAYPSHYSWDNFAMANPYYTIYNSASSGKARLKEASMVVYIQGFEMRVAMSGLSLPVYIAHQMQACQDAGVSGWIVWNAAQSYEPTWSALRMLAAPDAPLGIAQARQRAEARMKPAQKAQ
jgi:hypothetical protein